MRRGRMEDPRLGQNFTLEMLGWVRAGLQQGSRAEQSPHGAGEGSGGSRGCRKPLTPFKG